MCNCLKSKGEPRITGRIAEPITLVNTSLTSGV